MKATYLLTASLVLIFVASGCQKSTAPVRQPAPPATNAAPDSTVPISHVDDATTETDVPAAADAPGDPGMNTEHDKTITQEQPSGDESSQAAPNEGDAEPPQ